METEREVESLVYVNFGQGTALNRVVRELLHNLHERRKRIRNGISHPALRIIKGDEAIHPTLTKYRVVDASAVTFA